VSDHYHYWKDGGVTYHNRYDTFEFVRGQEREPWKAMVEPPWERLREQSHKVQWSDQRRHKFAQYIINREFIRDYADFPSVRRFDGGTEFLERNRTAEDWLLHVETFDTHEPFFAPERFRADYPTSYRSPILDWPPYARVTEAPKECEELRANYCATVALRDHELGRRLDYIDTHAMWDDTALTVTTDHGFFGEHDWWVKILMPCYNEVAHIPLFLHHPDLQQRAGTRCDRLTHTIDVATTLLELHGQAPPPDNQGHSLLQVIAGENASRETLLYGVFGSAVNITDGCYTYFRYPKDLQGPGLFQYTLMPTPMKERFSVAELADATLAPPMPFTQGAPLLKVPVTPKSPVFYSHGPGGQQDTHTVLYDLTSDPAQLQPIRDPAVEQRLSAEMARLMRANDAPRESFTRLDL
jgi:arylsulfatase A-like enzyme